MSNTETFEDYMREERNNFVREVDYQNWNSRMRNAAENLLVAYDQMRDKLFPVNSTGREDHIPDSGKMVGEKELGILIEEEWDANSILMGTDIDDLSYYASRCMMTEKDFEKAVRKIFPTVQLPSSPEAVHEDKDLQEQVRDHIKSYGKFFWIEALTANEMIHLEQLLLTFCPITQPGSVAYEKWKRHISNSEAVQPVKTKEEVKTLDEIFEKWIHYWVNNEDVKFISARESENYDLPKAIKGAMKEYAQQFAASQPSVKGANRGDAIEFAEWLTSQYEMIMGRFYEVVDSKNCHHPINIVELYNIFKESKG